MSTGGFCLLWGKTLESSLWVRESKETRLLWLTMLMMKDSEGVVRASVVGLADRAKITVAECRESLKVLMSPDPEDTSKVQDGRRILEVTGGWQVINHDLYRFSTEAKREFWRATKAEQRAAERVPPGTKRKRRGKDAGKPLPGEAAAIRAMEAGDEKGAAAIAAERSDPGLVAEVLEKYRPEPGVELPKGTLIQAEVVDAVVGSTREGVEAPKVDTEPDLPEEAFQ